MIWVSLTPIQCRPIGVAGDKQHRQRRTGRLHASGDLGTAHSGHGEIDQHQVDIGAVLQQFERGSAAPRLQHRVAQVAQSRGVTSRTALSSSTRIRRALTLTTELVDEAGGSGRSGWAFKQVEAVALRAQPPLTT